VREKENLGADLINKGEGVRGLDMLNGSKALHLVSTVIEAVGAVTPLAQEAGTEADAILAHTFALLAFAELAGITRHRRALASSLRSLLLDRPGGRGRSG